MDDSKLNDYEEQDFYEKLWSDARNYGRAEAFRRNGGGWDAYEELYGERREDFE